MSNKTMIQKYEFENVLKIRVVTCTGWSKFKLVSTENIVIIVYLFTKV